VLWIGTADGLEARVAPAEGIPFATVATGKIRRSSNPLKMMSAANMRDIAKVPLGVAQARKLVADFEPDVVLATGGYVAVPRGAGRAHVQASTGAARADGASGPLRCPMSNAAMPGLQHS